MGFEKANFKTVFANEFNPRIANSFEFSFNQWANYKNNSKYYIKPINKSIDDLSIDMILKKSFNSNPPKLFGVIGGPPCQDFSQSGSVSGLDGERGKFTLSFIDKILGLKPSFFVMENVKGLMTFKSLKKDFKNVVTQFSDNYYLSYKVHNALEYDVPQHRERMILIGIRKDLVNFTIGERLDDFIPYSKYKSNVNLKELSQEQKVENSLIYNEQSLAKNHIYPNLLDKSLKKISNIEEGDVRGRSFKRISRKKYSPTLSFGHNEIFIHPTEDRRLSVRECLRLQGVDDSYYFSTNDSLTTMYKILSNGVPVPLAQGIANSLRDFLFEHIIFKNGHLDKRKKKSGDVKNSIKEHETRVVTEIIAS